MPSKRRKRRSRPKRRLTSTGASRTRTRKPKLGPVGAGSTAPTTSSKYRFTDPGGGGAPSGGGKKPPKETGTGQTIHGTIGSQDQTPKEQKPTYGTGKGSYSIKPSGKAVPIAGTGASPIGGSGGGKRRDPFKLPSLGNQLVRRATDGERMESVRKDVTKREEEQERREEARRYKDVTTEQILKRHVKQDEDGNPKTRKVSVPVTKVSDQKVDRKLGELKDDLETIREDVKDKQERKYLSDIVRSSTARKIYEIEDGEIVTEKVKEPAVKKGHEDKFRRDIRNVQENAQAIREGYSVRVTNKQRKAMDQLKEGEEYLAELDPAQRRLAKQGVAVLDPIAGVAKAIGEVSEKTGVAQIFEELNRPGAVVRTLLQEGSNKQRVNRKGEVVDEDFASIGEAWAEPHGKDTVSGADLARGYGLPEQLGLPIEIATDPLMYVGAGALPAKLSKLSSVARAETLISKRLPKLLDDAGYKALVAESRRTGDFTRLDEFLKYHIKKNNIKGRVSPRKVKKRSTEHRNAFNEELRKAVSARAGSAPDIGGRPLRLPGKDAAAMAAATARSANLTGSLRPGFRVGIGNPLRPLDRPWLQARVPLPDWLPVPALSKTGRYRAANSAIGSDDVPYNYAPRWHQTLGEFTENLSTQRLLRETTRQTRALARTLDQEQQEALVRALRPLEGDATGRQRVGLWLHTRSDLGSEEAANKLLGRLSDEEYESVRRIDAMMGEQARQGTELGTLQAAIDNYFPRIWNPKAKTFDDITDPQNPYDKSLPLGETHGAKQFSSRHRNEPDFTATADPALLADAIVRLFPRSRKAAEATAEKIYGNAQQRMLTELIARQVQRGSTLSRGQLTSEEIRAVTNGARREDPIFDPVAWEEEAIVKLAAGKGRERQFDDDAFAGLRPEEADAARLYSAEKDLARIIEARDIQRQGSALYHHYDMLRQRIAGEISQLRRAARAHDEDLAEAEGAYGLQQQRLREYEALPERPSEYVWTRVKKGKDKTVTTKVKTNAIDEKRVDKAQAELEAKVAEWHKTRSAGAKADVQAAKKRLAQAKEKATENGTKVTTKKIPADAQYITENGRFTISKKGKEWQLKDAEQRIVARTRTLDEAKAAANEVRFDAPFRTRQGRVNMQRKADVLRANVENVKAARAELNAPVPPHKSAGTDDPFDYTGRLNDIRRDQNFPVLDPTVAVFYRSRTEAVNAALHARWQGLDEVIGVDRQRALESGWESNRDGSIIYDPNGVAYKRPGHESEGPLGASIERALGPEGGERLWPARVIEDARLEALRLGEASYREVLELGLEGAVNKTLAMMRYGVTTPFPAYHIRNMISDVLKSVQAGGTGVVFHPIMTAKLLGLAIRRGRKGVLFEIPAVKWRNPITGKTGVTKGHKLRVTSDKVKVPGFDKPLNYEEFLYMTDLFGIRSGQHLAEFLAIARKGRPTNRADEIKSAAALELGPSGAVGKRMIEVGARREDIARFLTFMQRMRTNKGDVADAAWYMTKHHFDYGDLTANEKRIVRNMFLFYTWYRKNIPLQFMELISRPGFFSGVANTYYAMPEGETPLNFDWSQIHPTLPDMSGPMPMKGLVPDYMKNPLGALQTNWNGHAFAFAFAAPWTDINLVNNLISTDSEARLQGGRQVASMLNPAFGMALSLLYQTDPLTGRRYKEFEPAPDIVADLLGKVGVEIQYDKQADAPAIPRFWRSVLNYIPVLGRASGYGMPEKGLYDTGRMGTHKEIASFLGFSTYLSPSKSREQAAQYQWLRSWTGRLATLQSDTSNILDSEQKKKVLDLEKQMVAEAKEKGVSMKFLKENAQGFPMYTGVPDKGPSSPTDFSDANPEDTEPGVGEFDDDKTGGSDKFQFEGVDLGGDALGSSSSTSSVSGKYALSRPDNDDPLARNAFAHTNVPDGKPVSGSADAETGKSQPSGGGKIRFAANTQLTAEQQQFAKAMTKESGLDPAVVAAWVRREGGHGGPDHNWLNVGWTDSGPAAVTRAREWRTPKSAGKTTARWLKGEWGDQYDYNAASSIQNNLRAAAGADPQEQMRLIATSGWATANVLPGLQQLYQEESGAKGGPVPKALKPVPLKVLRKHVKFTEPKSEVRDEQGAPARVTLTKMNPELQHGLVKLSKNTGIPVQINEGYRTAEHANDFPSGTASQHHQGNAADVDNHAQYTAKDLERAGLNNTAVAGEPWHFQPNTLGGSTATTSAPSSGGTSYGMSPVSSAGGTAPAPARETTIGATAALTPGQIVKGNYRFNVGKYLKDLNRGGAGERTLVPEELDDEQVAALYEATYDLPAIEDVEELVAELERDRVLV